VLLLRLRDETPLGIADGPLLDWLLLPPLLLPDDRRGDEAASICRLVCWCMERE
jgi:hypothetical protein